MNVNDLPRAPEPPVPHPLALELVRAIAARIPPARVLVIGVGSGRNLPVLLATGARVAALDDDTERLREVSNRYAGVDARAGSYAAPYPFPSGFAGALSTHALLHGRRTAVSAALAAVRAVLAPSGHFFTTLGSTRDPRYGEGECGDDGTVTLASGPEAGVRHVFFDESAVRDLFSAYEIVTLAHVRAAETAGRWAHSAVEASTLVHWFVHARAPSS